jgi:hypothetical protein
MLFVAKANRPIDRSGLLKLLHKMGECADVKDVHPNRWYKETTHLLEWKQEFKPLQGRLDIHSIVVNPTIAKNCL